MPRRASGAAGECLAGLRCSGRVPRWASVQRASANASLGFGCSTRGEATWNRRERDRRSGSLADGGCPSTARARRMGFDFLPAPQDMSSRTTDCAPARERRPPPRLRPTLAVPLPPGEHRMRPACRQRGRSGACARVLATTDGERSAGGTAELRAERTSPPTHRHTRYQPSRVRRPPSTTTQSALDFIRAVARSTAPPPLGEPSR
jgi:hypothetical protein